MKAFNRRSFGFASLILAIGLSALMFQNCSESLPAYESSTNQSSSTAAGKFIKHPEPQTVDVGATVQFKVELSAGTGSATFQWYKEGAPVSGGNSAILNLFNVTVADSGFYYVSVIPNSTKKAIISRTAMLQVNAPATPTPTPSATPAAATPTPSAKTKVYHLPSTTSTFVVPPGVSKVTAFLWGAGGGAGGTGGSSSPGNRGGHGGAGGFAKCEFNVIAGETLSVVVGSGGGGGHDRGSAGRGGGHGGGGGGFTSIKRGATYICIAGGGGAGSGSAEFNGGPGGDAGAGGGPMGAGPYPGNQTAAGAGAGPFQGATVGTQPGTPGGTPGGGAGGGDNGHPGGGGGGYFGGGAQSGGSGYINTTLVTTSEILTGSGLVPPRTELPEYTVVGDDPNYTTPAGRGGQSDDRFDAGGFAETGRNGRVVLNYVQ